MEYQNIINLLDNTPNQPSKFKTKNWVEMENGNVKVNFMGLQRCIYLL